MTTSPVMGITDELVSELEALASKATMGNWCTDGLTWVCAKDSDQLNGGYVLACCEGPDDFANAEYMAKASPLVIRALLAERAELKRDAERYRWLRQSMWYVGPDNFFCGEGGEMNDYENHNYLATNLDAAIDAAMQSEAKP